MQQHSLTFPFKTHYHTLGARSPSTRQIWFVLHGYGQLAAYFIRRFNALEQRNIYVIAPEGLSRFYIESLGPTGRSSDRVGASWMTKEYRLTDIENYLAYLHQLFEKEVGIENTVPVTILGFSQGAATASRWATSKAFAFHRLLLWSGMFPPDLNISAGKEFLTDKEIAVIYGNSDPFLNDSRFAEFELINARLGIKPKVVSFDGKHEINEDTLLQFA